MKKEFAHQRFECKVGPKRENGCSLWMGAKNGLGRGIFVERFYPRTVTSAPRFAYRFYIGPIPENRYVMQSCKNALCIAPAHLILMTKSQAAKRSIALRPRPHLKILMANPPAALVGISNGNARYSDDLVHSIRQERATGQKLILIAMRRKMPLSTVAFICNGRLG